jgi:hypothetical protein
LQNKENDQNKKQREMDFLKAVNIIGRDLEEAMALLEQLSGISGSDLAEIELARSRVRSAADLLKLLPALNPPVSAAPEVAQPPSVIRNEVAESVTVKNAGAVSQAGTAAVESDRATVRDVAGDQPSVTESVKADRATVRDDGGEQPSVSKPVTADAVTVEQSAVAVAHDQEAGHGRKNTGKGTRKQEPSKPILADRFTQGGTLGEKISTGRQDEVISSVIQSKPIDDIAAAIGINDRFYFIRELFSGDSAAYADTIRRLNGAVSLGEAMKILDESTVMGSDPAAQSSFVDVVRRKFSINV